MKGLLIVGAATLLILVGGAFLLSSNFQPQQLPKLTDADRPSVPQYYWGDGCPHCAEVSDFLDGWEHTADLQVESFETWYNKDNARKMAQVGEYCGIPKTQIGVPLLWTPEGECIIGDEPIIDYYKSLFEQ